MKVDDDSSRLRKRYAGVEVLILFAVVRDLIVTKPPVYPMYLYGLPLIMIGQTAATYIYLSGWPA
jgi:hypothetical protein